MIRWGWGGLAKRLGALVLTRPQGQQTHQELWPCSSGSLPWLRDGTLTPATLFPAGGLATVIYTDALQTVIMVVGAVILAIKGEVWGLGKGGLSQHPEEFFRLSHSGSARLLAS